MRRRLLVRPRPQGARSATAPRSRRRRRRRGAALSQASPDVAAAEPRRCRQRRPDRSRLPRLAARDAAPAGAGRAHRCRAVRLRWRTMRPRAGASRRRGATARCCAARSCIGCCNRCRTCRGAARARRRARYLARARPRLDRRRARRDSPRKVLAVLDDPRFARAVRARQPGRGADRRAACTAAGRRPVSGQSTGWWSRRREVLIADYKTNRAAPRTPRRRRRPATSRQLALYRAVLAKLYPGRPVRAALVWTEVPDLMEISAAVLDAALAPLTSA